MKELLPFLIAGLTTGSIYGLAGVGLVLTYKTSGIFNFAHGSLATVAAFVFYTLREEHHMPWPAALIISVLVVGPALGFVFEVLGRKLSGTSLAVRVVGTLGVLLIVEAVVLILYGTTTTRVVSQFLPSSSFMVDGTPVTATDIILFVIPLAATSGLYSYFRVSRNGVATRAVVENPDLLDLAGTSPLVVRRRAWIVGVTFASLSGVLVAPLLAQIDSTSLTLLVITAFGAAAVGAFTSLPLTFVGGLGIGVAGSLATKYFTTGFMAQVPSALPFVVLFVVLLIAPRRRLAEQSMTLMRNASTWRSPLSLQAGGGVAVLVLLLFVPQFAGVHLADWTTLLADVIMFLSLGLLVRTSGQVSLCQVSFMAIGVAAFSHLTTGQHLPWLLALLVSGLIVVPIGALLAIPAIRLSGLYLALASLGFGIVVEYMFYTEGYMFGGSGAGSNVPRPEVSWLNVASDNGYYYLLLAFVVMTTGLVIGLNHSRLGRLLRAMSDSTTGLATTGASVNVTKVLVFCISAFLAAIAGALGGGVVGVVTAGSYSPLLSLTYFAVIMISVGGEPWYALLGAAGITLIPSYIHGANVSNYLTLAFGVGAIGYALTPPERRGAPAAVRSLIDGIFRRPAKAGRRQRTAFANASEGSDLAPLSGRTAPITRGGLTIEDLRVTFGGLVAVGGVSLEAPTGRITGLIGPNGAGKTTTFNVCSGLGSPTGGRVELDGRSIAHHGPAARARMGLGRTFQQMELFDSLTVRENIALGREGGYVNANPALHLISLPHQKLAANRATREALALCGLADIADRPVGALSTGQRRLVELARCLAGSHRILLLDEPSSGLDRTETENFARILRTVAEQRGVGILIVEHDMSLVTSICEYVYVLDFGKMIFAGTPREVVESALVRAAYLGDEALVVAGLEAAMLESEA